MAIDPRHVRPWVMVAVFAVAVSVVGLFALSSGSGAGYPVTPNAEMKKTLEGIASRVASDDNVAKTFPQQGEVVLTSEGEALDLEGSGDQVSGPTDQAVYLVQVSGEFVANDIPAPPEFKPTPIGAFYFLVNPDTGETTDFGTAEPRDLSKLGQVSEIELTPPASPSPTGDK